MSLTSAATGQGDSTLHFTVAAHDEPASRTAVIVVNEEQVQIAQDGRPCELRFSSTHETVDAAGGDRTIAVIASGAQCGWRATSEVPWIAVVAGWEGTGNGSVTLRVEPTGGPPRTGTVTIAGRPLHIEQGAGCAYSIGTTVLALGSSGGAGGVPVSTSAGCAWTAVSEAEWITITGGSTGNGPGEVRVSVTPWNGPGRTGTIRVAGQIVSVTQGSGCSFTITPANQSVGAAGGSGTSRVDAPAGCTWSAGTGASWILVTAGATGSGPGQVSFTVGASSGAARTGTLIIAGETFTVAQADGCSYGISPATQDVAASGGSVATSVTTGPGCVWNATPTVPWLTVSAGATGSGPGQVSFTVAANSGPARSSTLSIAGQTFTVRQADGCSYGISPATQDVAASGGSAATSVTTGPGCVWNAGTNVPWLTVTAGQTGSGQGQVQVAAALNNGPPRTGTLTIAGHTFTVNQASSCSYDFSPPSHAFDANSGNGAVLILTAGPCTWDAVSNADWITITSGASGTGNGMTQFAVTANNGPARIGSLTIGARSYTVTQAGR